MRGLTRRSPSGRGDLRIREKVASEAAPRQVEGGEFLFPMAVALDMQSADFERRFQALLAAKRESSADVDLAVADIIEDVRQRGDAALAELSLRFDRVEIGRLGLKIGAAETETAIAACDKTALEALKLAHARVMDFHLRQKPADVRFTDPLGVELGWRWRPSTRSGSMFLAGRRAIRPRSS